MARQSFGTFGADAADLEQAYRDRLEDARALLAHGRHAAAVMFGTYSIEILLKRLICKTIHEPKLPTAFQVHDLEGLLVIAGPRRRLNMRKNAAVKTNWDSIAAVAEEAINYRYEPVQVVSAAGAEQFVQKLTDSADGIIPWLEQYL